MASAGGFVAAFSGSVPAGVAAPAKRATMSSKFIPPSARFATCARRPSSAISWKRRRPVSSDHESRLA